MNKKSEIEMERARIIKITRTLTRLKHSLNADEEINDVLPARLSEFDSALQDGELKTLTSNVGETLDDLAKLLES